MTNLSRLKLAQQVAASTTVYPLSLCTVFLTHSDRGRSPHNWGSELSRNKLRTKGRGFFDRASTFNLIFGGSGVWFDVFFRNFLRCRSINIELKTQQPLTKEWLWLKIGSSIIWLTVSMVTVYKVNFSHNYNVHHCMMPCKKQRLQKDICSKGKTHTG